MSAESASGVRVAISGIGMVTPCGADRESSWHGLIACQSALRWLTASEHTRAGCDIHRTRMAGAPARVPAGIIPADSFTTPSGMAISAAREALEDADLTLKNYDPWRCGIVLGTSKGHLAANHHAWQQRHAWQASDRQHPAADWGASWANAPAMSLAADLHARGPVLVPVAACATGMLSICRGVELIRDGHCDLVVAGSTDDSLCEMLWASYRRLGVLARVSSIDPALACRPFDRERCGFLMGSGAAVVVLERFDNAQARRHTPYAEWLSGGMLADGYALTQVSPDAAGLARLVQDVLRRGSLHPAAIDYINLHGTGTRENDRYETRGLRQALGTAVDEIPCSSLKGTIGHLLGAAGSVEFAAMLLAMRDGIIPPTANLHDPDPECNLNCTPLTAATHSIDVALKLSLGFGGHLVAGLVRNCRP